MIGVYRFADRQAAGELVSSAVAAHRCPRHREFSSSSFSFSLFIPRSLACGAADRRMVSEAGKRERASQVTWDCGREISFTSVAFPRCVWLFSFSVVPVLHYGLGLGISVPGRALTGPVPILLWPFSIGKPRSKVSVSPAGPGENRKEKVYNYRLIFLLNSKTQYFVYIELSKPLKPSLCPSLKWF